MVRKLRHGTFILLDKLLRWVIHPGLRARLLRIFGADIGHGVRIHEVQLFNLSQGFRNLHIGDGAFVGPGCKFDLDGPLVIGARSSISVGVTILTHEDAGTFQRSKLIGQFAPKTTATHIGDDCWIGANAVVLCGIHIENCAVIGAGSVVTRDVSERSVAYGMPAVKRRTLDIDA